MERLVCVCVCVCVWWWWRRQWIGDDEKRCIPTDDWIESSFISTGDLHLMKWWAYLLGLACHDFRHRQRHGEPGSLNAGQSWEDLSCPVSIPTWSLGPVCLLGHDLGFLTGSCIQIHLLYPLPSIFHRIFPPHKSSLLTPLLRNQHGIPFAPNAFKTL